MLKNIVDRELTERPKTKKMNEKKNSKPDQKQGVCDGNDGRGRGLSGFLGAAAVLHGPPPPPAPDSVAPSAHDRRPGHQRLLPEGLPGQTKSKDDVGSVRRVRTMLGV